VELNLEQSRLVEEVAELLQQRLQPCIVGSIGRRLHSHHKLRMDPGPLRQQYNIGHIEQRSQLHLLDCPLQVPKG
jgi:hypothetical protein